MLRRVFYELGRALRETGQAADRLGLRAIEKPVFKEPFSRHRTVMNLYDQHPIVSPDVFVAPNASVVGRVSIGSKSSVWYGAVIRGDLNTVTIGRNTAIQDRAVIHTAKSVEGHVEAVTHIGTNVIVGPGALLQSCIVEDEAVIGAGAVVLEGALIEKGAKVADGAVVHPGRRIPAGQLWAGNPAVFVRDLTKSELAEAEGHAEEVAELASEHAHEFLPYTTAYQQAEALGMEASDKALAQIKARHVVRLVEEGDMTAAQAKKVLA